MPVSKVVENDEEYKKGVVSMLSRDLQPIAEYSTSPDVWTTRFSYLNSVVLALHLVQKGR